MRSICPKFQSIYSTPIHKFVMRVSNNEYYTYDFCACSEKFSVIKHANSARRRIYA